MYPTDRRRRSSGELRVRSGCRKCRERRVKCPEERPVCYHCKRLGLNCLYEIRLTWQPSCKFAGGASVQSSAWSARRSVTNRWHSYDVAIKEWMFLGTTFEDFNTDTVVATETPVSPVSACPTDLQGGSGPSPSGTCRDPIRAPKADIAGQTLLAAPKITGPILHPGYMPFMSLSQREGRLWGYFNEFIIPQCSLEDFTSPYRKIILRIAASSLDGPLFQCIMAVSARQMQILGHGPSDMASWAHRHRALSALRLRISQVGSLGTEMAEDDSPEQIIASTLMMCFFEIMSDCSSSWEMHADFCRKFLLSLAANRSKSLITSERSELSQFAAAYMISHDTLAATARSPRLLTEPNSALEKLVGDDEFFFRNLTGCPKRLAKLLSDISHLAAEEETNAQPLDCRGPPASGHTARTSPSQGTKNRRDDIERELHHMQQPAEGIENMSAAVIAETKRLTTLLYLYARLDNCSPSHPQVARVTGQLLALIPRISLRTNTVLWPLFMVATLGVRPEADSDRRQVLETLDSLQRTRQLGNVRKARRVIEEVWKARDLRREDAVRGWDILRGRCEAISLA